MCPSLGSILLTARAMGHDIGWSFQLQDPRMILLLMLLSLAIALNLAGLFEVSAPSLSGNWMAKKGGLGAFGTGALAALIATPRSEEHTSELQSLMRISYAVFCLKNKNQ